MKDRKFIVVRWRMSAFRLSSWDSDYVTYKKKFKSPFASKLRPWRLLLFSIADTL
jgi:hypothetical protein